MVRMDITAELAIERGIPPDTAAHIAQFRDDPAAVAHATAMHQQHGVNPTWPTLARYWINEGASWPQIVATLGLDRLDEDAKRRELTEKLEQAEATIKRRDATIAALRKELQEARAHAAARASRQGR
jgi:hypothetical protein